MVGSGGGLALVRELMQHSFTATTQRYIKRSSNGLNIFSSDDIL